MPELDKHPAIASILCLLCWPAGVGLAQHLLHPRQVEPIAERSSVSTTLLRRIFGGTKKKRFGKPREAIDLASEYKQLLTRILVSSMPPVDRYIALSIAHNNHGLFHYSYEDWRLKRINKILELYGIEFFENKTVLELGGGHGDIGAFFADLGARVLCLDGRAQNVNFARLKHRNIHNFQCRQFDLETDFSEFGKFDLIINFGLIYHLKNVNKHLECCFRMSDDILIESVFATRSIRKRLNFAQMPT